MTQLQNVGRIARLQEWIHTTASPSGNAESFSDAVHTDLRERLVAEGQSDTGSSIPDTEKSPKDLAAKI